MKGLEEYLEQRKILALLAGYGECQSRTDCFSYAEKYWRKMVQFQEKVVAQCKKDEIEFGYSQDMSGDNFPYACASFEKALHEICPACAVHRESMLRFLADSKENAAELLSQENSSDIFRKLVSNKVWFSTGPTRLPGGWSSATPEIVREWAENALSE
tara:strand:+ start:1418 stop:1891 length:474 start_codon:yes stop_codon:yes gene_type:complete